jgi:hypothetical protein
VPEDEAERCVWAAVNKMTGGKKSGSGRGHTVNNAPVKKATVLDVKSVMLEG